MREEAEDALREWRGCPMGRRAFLKVVGSGIVLTLAAPVLTSCSGVTSTLDAVLEGKRSFTDDAGRQMTLPTADRLKRIYFTSTAAQIFCFTLMPSLLAGTAFKFTKEELAYLPAGTASLPYMGTLTDGGQINREMLLTEDVQIVFSISSVGLTDQNISEAETLQNATKIPVLCFDGSMERIAQCYRRLGDVMGCGTRAEELASYCEGVYTRVAEAIATVSDTERVSLYYAEGPEGLQTEPDTSQHAQTFVVAGARNVATVAENAGVGMSNVSLEQVLAWDPEVIVAWDDVVRGGADEDIRINKDWAALRAVKTGRVYSMPNTPFAWLDRPPAVNRFLGIQWIANMLYPAVYDVDMVQVTKDFYKKMFWVDITDDQAKTLLGNSYPPYGT